VNGNLNPFWVEWRPSASIHRWVSHSVGNIISGYSVALVCGIATHWHGGSKCRVERLLMHPLACLENMTYFGWYRLAPWHRLSIWLSEGPFGSSDPVSKPAPAKIAWSSFENVSFAKFGCDLAGPVLKPELPNGPLNQNGQESTRLDCSQSRRPMSSRTFRRTQISEDGFARGVARGPRRKILIPWVLKSLSVESVSRALCNRS